MFQANGVGNFMNQGVVFESACRKRFFNGSICHKNIALKLEVRRSRAGRESIARTGRLFVVGHSDITHRAVGQGGFYNFNKRNWHDRAYVCQNISGCSFFCLREGGESIALFCIIGTRQIPFSHGKTVCNGSLLPCSKLRRPFF